MYLPKQCRRDTTAQDKGWDGLLCVPFEQKDAAKALGALWDASRRVWVVPPALRSSRAKFEAWDKTRHHAHTQPTSSQADAAEFSALNLKRARITQEIIQALCGSHT